MNERHKKRRRIIISRVYRQVGIHRCTNNLAIALISAFVYVTKGWWMQQLVHDRDSWNYSNRWNWLYATITFLRSLTSPPPLLSPLTCCGTCICSHPRRRCPTGGYTWPSRPIRKLGTSFEGTSAWNGYRIRLD